MLPILVLCYIRLDTLMQTFESILNQPHGDIYASCDGSPEKYAAESLEVQRYLRNLFDTGVIKELRISSINQGVFYGVSSGIDWFFNQVDRGIIFEDDLVLQPNLLNAVELASIHLENREIISIGLSNYVPSKYLSQRESVYRYSRFTIAWGWVSTHKEWFSRIDTYQNLSYTKLFWKMFKNIGFSSALYHILVFLRERNYELHNPSKCNWDSLWQLTAFMKEKKVLVFNRNLLTNIGYGETATHTKIKSVDYPTDTLLDEEIRMFRISDNNLSVDMKADKYFMRERKFSNFIRDILSLRTRTKRFLSSTVPNT